MSSLGKLILALGVLNSKTYAEIERNILFRSLSKILLLPWTLAILYKFLTLSADAELLVFYSWDRRDQSMCRFGKCFETC